MQVILKFAHSSVAAFTIGVLCLSLGEASQAHSVASSDFLAGSGLAQTQNDNSPSFLIGLDEVEGDLESGAEEAVDTAEEVADDVEDGIEEGAEVTTDTAEEVADDTEDGIEDGVDATQGAFEDAEDTAESAVDDAGDEIDEAAEDTGSFIEETF